MKDPTGGQSTIGRWASAALSVVLAVAGAVFGLIVMGVAFVVGLVVAAVIVAWALLRGRAPGRVDVMRFGHMARRRGRPDGHLQAVDEVVDIDAREIDADDPGRRR